MCYLILSSNFFEIIFKRRFKYRNKKQIKSHAIDLTNRQMDIAIAKSEYKRIRFFIGALLVGLAIMSFNFFVVKDTTEFFNNRYTKFLVIGWFVAFLIYEVVGYLIAGIYLRKKIVVLSFMKISHVSIEAAFPSILLFALCYVEQTVIFLDSPLLFFYFILIGISALNLEVRLGLLVGIVSAGGYLMVTIWAVSTFDPANVVLHFPPVLYIARSLFMMMAALGSVFVANEIKNRTRLSFEFIHQKREMEMLFGQQVSKKVVNTLISDNYTSKKRNVTVLFLDIRNFSTFAESKDPKEVIKYQNNLFGPIIRIINEYNGITNQIMGDGLMATFGAPVKDKNHAENALMAGLAILNKIETMSESGLIPQTRIGIGAHTGQVVMGNIGNEIRKQFSISGTTVIIAARLEQVNKKYDTQFLVSRELLENLDPSKYKFGGIGDIKVHNIAKRIQVYKVA